MPNTNLQFILVFQQVKAFSLLGWKIRNESRNWLLSTITLSHSQSSAAPSKSLFYKQKHQLLDLYLYSTNRNISCQIYISTLQIETSAARFISLHYKQKHQLLDLYLYSTKINISCQIYISIIQIETSAARSISLRYKKQ